MTQMPLQKPPNVSLGQVPPELQQQPQLTSEQAQKLSRLVNENYTKMKQARSSFERQWYLNMSFYFGKQNVVYKNITGAGGRLFTPPAPPWRVRMIVNKIRPIVRRELAKLTSQKPSVNGANEILNDAFLNLIGGSSADSDSVLVHEMHIKPGALPDFPEGGLVTVTGDQVIQYLPIFPYEHGQFCIAKFDHIPSGKYYATSVIEDLIPIQREFNRTRSQIVEAKNRMAKPQLVAPLGAINVSKMTTEPGLVIEYKPGFNPPQPLPLQPLPNYVLNEVQQLTADFDDISGQHEVTRGNVPPGVTAATAISYLQEQDDSMLTAEVDSIESGMEKVAKQTLSLIGQYWDVPRTVKITGVDGSWDAMMFKGSDLNGNTDIRIEAGSALPTSKAAKQALITDWMKLGFIPPEEGMQVLEMGGLVKLYERVQIDQG